MWSLPSSGATRAAIIAVIAAHRVVTAETASGGSDRMSAWLAEHPIATTSAAPPFPSSDTLAPELISMVLRRCPTDCSEAGPMSGNWTLYPQLGRLEMCNQTMLLDFTLFNSLRENEAVRACTAKFELDESTAADTTNNYSCLPDGDLIQVQDSLQLAFNESDTAANSDDLETTSTQLAAFLSHRDSNCTDTASFTYSNTTALGIFFGSGLGNIPTSLLKHFVAKVKSSGLSGTAIAQLCVKDGRSSKYSLGIAASANHDVRFVQDAVATWASGGCITSYDRAESWQNITLSVPSHLSNSTARTNSTSLNGLIGRKNALISRHTNKLVPRAYCSTIQVVSGDSCSSLAAECGISGSQFTQYNPQPNLCSTLAVGQHVCCTAGDMPNYQPQPNQDGTCYAYYVVQGDSCSALAASRSLTVAQIESFNSQTWGWEGCASLQAFQNICLSTGRPPMPAPIANAVCGPQKPGSTQPGAGTTLASLNPCPLNACCNKWGQCGITAEFCTPSQSSTGAPGTSAPGQNGCISNCGQSMVISGPPASQMSIGYFEAFNLQRSCLNMKITSMDMRPYTHIHLAFGIVTPGFAIDVSSIQVQFDAFKQMTGFKKILSLGGWAFSTEPATYFIFRNAVLPGNQDTFVNNIVSFVQQHNLDGIDIDWEYPAAPDIPGIPPGTSAERDNYLTFFQKLRNAMPSGKSISFAAPASYWYLRGFHIGSMAALADYVVYMTYDLHGQWDYANQWATEGCPAGNCLRSHVNMTETILALAMITKAGVLTNKIAVGVSSYGRSFQMTTPGCAGPMCTYTGAQSGARAGPCTETAGYIANAEILAILSGKGSYKTPSGALQKVSTYSTYFDTGSQSNIALYDNDNWVAFMDDAAKADRRALYQNFNFAGIVDWAIDLNGFGGDLGVGDASSNVVYPAPSIWSSPNPAAGCIAPCIIVFPPYPLSAPRSVNWPPLTTTLLSSGEGGVVKKTTTIPVPDFTITAVSIQPLTLKVTDTASYKINVVQSVTPPAFIYTLPPNHATFPATTPTPSTPSTGSPTPLIIIPPVTFRTTPSPITIQPQPTYSISIPSPPPKPVTVHPQTTSPPTCSGPGCGIRDCSKFGCKPGCGSYACDGGCGIFGCGGGCGVLGCIADCPLNLCGGLGCLVPGACGTDGSCDTPVTASACTYLVTSYSAWSMTSSTRITETSCATSTACNGQDTETYTTPGSPECTLDPVLEALLNADINDDAVNIDGELFPKQFEPNPTQPGINPNDYVTTGWDLDGTVTQVSTRVTTSTSSIRTIVTVQPTARASCAYWVIPVVPAFLIRYGFEIYNIENWATDGGKKLQKEENGCGVMSRWEWHAQTGDRPARAYFDLLLLTVKKKCVEKAILSAGGPDISCQLQGVDLRVFQSPLRRRTIDPSLPLLSIDPPLAKAMDPRPPLERRLVSDTASPRPVTEYYSSYSLPEATYVAATWPPGNVFTLDEPVLIRATSTYTTAIVLATVSPFAAPASALDRTGWTATADSYYGPNPPSSVLDGDIETQWHSMWGPDDPLPNSVIIDMKTQYLVNGLAYVPRQDQSKNGNIGEYFIYTSVDGAIWDLVAGGTWVNTKTLKTATFDGINAQYVKLTAITEASRTGQKWSSAAEIYILGNAVQAAQPSVNLKSCVLISREGWTAVADSYHSGNEASKAIDDDTASLWHTEWNPDIPMPHSITIDMKNARAINGLSYLPRQDSNTNGDIGTYIVTTSMDGSVWTAVTSGKWTNSKSWKTTSFPIIVAKFVRLTATTEVTDTGKPWANAAEINIRTFEHQAISRTGWVVSADSSMPDGTPEMAVDGSASSLWHTKWSPSEDPFPHSFSIDLGIAKSVGGLTYLPRSNGANGRIGQYKVQYSTTGNAWVDIVSGAWPDTSSLKSVDWTSITARYFRLVALSEAGGRGPWATAAEINLIDGSTQTTNFEVSVDSEETAAADSWGMYAFDRNMDTVWHTQWGSAGSLPHFFSVNMLAPYQLQGLTYTPIQNNANGRIGQYKVEISVSGSSWTTVATGTFADDGTPKIVSFTPASAQYIKLTALTEAGGRGPWTSASEITVQYDGSSGCST